MKTLLATFSGVLLTGLLHAQLTDLRRLHSFGETNQSSGVPDCRWTSAGLVEGPDGALYGTAPNGGTGLYTGGGAVFKVHKDGTAYTILRHFGINTTDARQPAHGVIVASDGNLYGTSVNGGNNDVGTVFKLNRDGSGYQILHHFAPDPDAFYPFAGVIEGSDGVLYGTSTRPVVGAIYKINKNGTGYAILKYLNESLDGARPEASLIEAADGRLYGTTVTGGSYRRGTLFRMNKDGSGFLVLR
ncbi:MAG TPA: choice-of-anchor tandem repeat GloVer-containing protein, partial [Verrucomicrobiae bacterium]|nr:choice-of-anchor tandem repeat GloVer-containing protein [Verrucomicrobiae bacterium]